MARPTHTLTVKKKDGDGPAKQVGVAWINERGWFNIKLNPCTTLTDRDDLWINMYPIDYDDIPQERRRPPQNGGILYDNNDYIDDRLKDDEDIPF